MIAPFVALCACSSSSGSAAKSHPMGDDDASSAYDASRADDGGGADAAASTLAAGKSGADAFCVAICGHEESCAATLDASPAGLTNCVSDCQSANEAPATTPPTELLRADYVSDLGACIARASCSEALQTSEATCASTVVSALVPTQAVAVFCHDVETSPCVAQDSGTPDCVTGYLPYSDDALNAASACFADPSCASLGSCYAAAFTQK
jgi:hypothetical protein